MKPINWECNHQKPQASARGLSRTQVHAKDRSPAVATSSKSPAQPRENGAGIFSALTPSSTTEKSAAHRSSWPAVGPTSESSPTSSNATRSSPCPSNSPTRISANESAQATRFATLQQRLDLWPLDNANRCPCCQLPACWCINSTPYCVSPLCDPHGRWFAFLDQFFQRQGRPRKNCQNPTKGTR